MHGPLNVKFISRTRNVHGGPVYAGTWLLHRSGSPEKQDVFRIHRETRFVCRSLHSEHKLRRA